MLSALGLGFSAVSLPMKDTADSRCADRLISERLMGPVHSVQMKSSRGLTQKPKPP